MQQRAARKTGIDSIRGEVSNRTAILGCGLGVSPKVNVFVQHQDQPQSLTRVGRLVESITGQQWGAIQCLQTRSWRKWVTSEVLC